MMHPLPCDALVPPLRLDAHLARCIAAWGWAAGAEFGGRKIRLSEREEGERRKREIRGTSKNRRKGGYQERKRKEVSLVGRRQ